MAPTGTSTALRRPSSHIPRPRFSSTHDLSSPVSPTSSSSFTSKLVQAPSPLRTTFSAALRKTLYHLQTLHLFVEGDLARVLVPQTLFAAITLLSGPLLLSLNSPSSSSSSPAAAAVPWPTVVKALLPTATWIYANLLPFCIFNQLDHNSIQEDKLNHPSRPLASGRLSQPQAKRLMFAGYAFALALGWTFGGTAETLALVAEGWLYNGYGLDLSSRSVAARAGLTAAGYATFGLGAARVAATSAGVRVRGGWGGMGGWTAAMVGMIGMTIQGLDLGDLEGDRARGRRTMPIVYGDGVVRASVVAMTAVWSVVCPAFWMLRSVGVWLVLGAMVVGVLGWWHASRTWCIRGSIKEDKKTFKVWILWVIAIYFLPLFATA